MQQWIPSEDWWTRHTSQGLVYRITFRFSTSDLVDKIWAAAVAQRRIDNEVILDGGAYLKRVGLRDIEVGSGGEDALDSLEFCVNDLLFAVAQAIAPQEEPIVVREERQLDSDDY